MKPMSEEVKMKILQFFLKTSVPRIIEEERKKKKLDTKGKLCKNT